jgi:gamma-glutamyltranspeptidase/glutathione hydrolase
MSEYFTRKEVIAKNGMVVAKHRLAAEAGINVLKKGGNAVDAAVATSFAIGVVEPWYSGIAGLGYMTLYLSDTKESVFVCGAGRAPEKARPDMWELDPELKPPSYSDHKAVKDMANYQGYTSVCVPGLLSVLAKALEMYGTMSLEQAMQPAIKYAEEGFLVDWLDVAFIGGAMKEIVRFPGLSKILLRNGFPPAPSFMQPQQIADRLVQKDLARTLRKISDGGPDIFYKGEIAQTIVDDMERNGGLLSMKDLATYEPEIVKVIPGDYRGYEILHAPLAFTAGPMVMETLNILEGYNLSRLGRNSIQSLHVLCEALKLAFDDFYKMGDPDFVEVPLKKILSKEYANEQRRKIESRKAESNGARMEVQSTDRLGHGTSCTTHLGVIDKDRNMVSLTQTIGAGCGSGIVVGDTGIILNGCMCQFDPEPGKPLSVAPRKRPTTPCTPILITKDGNSFMNIGAPGGGRIQASLIQVIINVIDYGLGIQKAMESPRIDCGSCASVEMIADSRISEKTSKALERMGHNISHVKDLPWSPGGPYLAFARPVGILVDLKKGRLHGGVDPSKRSLALGY